MINRLYECDILIAEIEMFKRENERLAQEYEDIVSSLMKERKELLCKIQQLSQA